MKSHARCKPNWADTVLNLRHTAADTPTPAGGRRAVDAIVGPPVGHRGWAWIWGSLALALGLAVTVSIHRYEQRGQQGQQLTLYTNLANTGFQSLQEQLNGAEWLLRAVQTLFLASDQVTPGEFAAFYQNLHPRTQFPSLLAMTFAQRQMRAGAVHYVLTLAEPAHDNHRQLGRELGTGPTGLDDLHRSRDSDQPELSSPFALARDDGARAITGILMRLPVFSAGPPPRDVAERRARLQGFIAFSWRVDDFIGHALPSEVTEVLTVRVTDITGGAPLPLFGPRQVASAVPAAMRMERTFDIHGRVWKVSMWPHDPGAMTKDVSESFWPAGLLVSVLLGLLVFSVASTRQRALDLGWRMSRRYRESEERFRALNELLPALVLLARVDGEIITYANQASRERLGDRVREGRLSDLFIDGEMPAPLEDTDGHDGSRTETRLRESNGNHFWADVAMSKITLDGESTLLMVATDVSERRALTQLLSHQATHDALTDLVNRREFERRLGAALLAARPHGPHAAVLYLDLDQFKLINDTSGHLAGDQLLIQLATLMGRQLGSGDVLARLGGDEFGVLAGDVAGWQGAEAVAERLRQCIDGYAFVWEQNSYMISASVGVVMIDRPRLSVRDVLAQADTACYLAKEAGRNRVHFYRAQDDETAQRRGEMDWANRLRLAISEHRLVLTYQEIHELPLGTAGGVPRVELLLRFREDDGRLVAPGVFMPAAERYGLMPIIDRWVVETALANFEQMHPSGARLGLAAINLSGASVEDESLADLIIELLHRFNIAPTRVCFEITETVAVRKLAQVAHFMERLRSVGCAISLDDFGIGMSSFAYLKNLPISIIKIDGSFIRDMLSDPVSRVMVRSVTDIGHRLGLGIVAEWVGDLPTVDALTELQVNYAQGYVLHKPELVPLHQR